MKRAKTLERFVEKHPDVKLVLLDVADANDEVPRGSIYDTNNKASDVLEVQTLPTMMFMTDDGGELSVIEGAVPMNELEKAHREAVKYQNAAKSLLEAPSAPAPSEPKNKVAAP